MPINKKHEINILQKFNPNSATSIIVQISMMGKWFDVTVPKYNVDAIVSVLDFIDELDVNNVLNKIIKFFHIIFISNLPSELHASVSACIREALVEASIENMIEESIDDMTNDFMDETLSDDSLFH